MARKVDLVLTNEQDGSTLNLAQGEFKVAPGFYRVAVRSAPDQRIDSILITDGNHTREVSKEGFQVKLNRGDRLNMQIRAMPLDMKPIPAAKSESPPTFTNSIGMERAKERQDAWAKHLGVPVEFTNTSFYATCTPNTSNSRLNPSPARYTNPFIPTCLAPSMFAGKSSMNKHSSGFASA